MKEIHIGAELLQLRKGAKVSQAHVAKEMGVDQSSISRWEAGEATPTSADIEKYLQALGTDPAAKEYLEHNPEILMAFRAVRARSFRPQDFQEVGGVQFRDGANVIIHQFMSWHMLKSGTGGRYTMEPALEQVLREFDED